MNEWCSQNNINIPLDNASANLDCSTAKRLESWRHGNATRHERLALVDMARFDEDKCFVNAANKKNIVQIALLKSSIYLHHGQETDHQIKLDFSLKTAEKWHWNSSIWDEMRWNPPNLFFCFYIRSIWVRQMWQIFTIPLTIDASRWSLSPRSVYLFISILYASGSTGGWNDNHRDFFQLTSAYLENHYHRWPERSDMDATHDDSWFCQMSVTKSCKRTRLIAFHSEWNFLRFYCKRQEKKRNWMKLNDTRSWQIRWLESRLCMCKDDGSIQHKLNRIRNLCITTAGKVKEFFFPTFHMKDTLKLR